MGFTRDWPPFKTWHWLRLDFVHSYVTFHDSVVICYEVLLINRRGGPTWPHPHLFSRKGGVIAYVYKSGSNLRIPPSNFSADYYYYYYYYYYETAGPDESRLLRKKFKDDEYMPWSRPVSNDSETLMVNFGISLLQIREVVSLLFTVAFSSSTARLSCRRRVSLSVRLSVCLSVCLSVKLN